VIVRSFGFSFYFYLFVVIKNTYFVFGDLWVCVTLLFLSAI